MRNNWFCVISQQEAEGAVDLFLCTNVCVCVCVYITSYILNSYPAKLLLSLSISVDLKYSGKQ